jgi:nucleotide-binding universal stress UspA family protein
MTATWTPGDILFATDFSEASRLAGQTAAEIARHFGTRLHVLHVVAPITDPTPAPAALRAAAAELEAGRPVVTSIASGRVAPQIVGYAHRNAIGLIVLGTHGRTGVSRAMLGSVAEAVMRRARCRVLTCRPGCPGNQQLRAWSTRSKKRRRARYAAARARGISSASRAGHGSAGRPSSASGPRSAAGAGSAAS